MALNVDPILPVMRAGRGRKITIITKQRREKLSLDTSTAAASSAAQLLSWAGLRLQGRDVY